MKYRLTLHLLLVDYSVLSLSFALSLMIVALGLITELTHDHGTATEQGGW